MAGVPEPLLLVVAHGSRVPASALVHTDLLGRIRTAAPELTVELAYVDHVAPSVSRALDAAAGAGRAVVVVPLLLSAASHSKGDVPAAIHEARGRHPGARIDYALVLGPHPLLVQALERRLSEAGVDPATAVVLAAAGAADPEANAEVARTARLLFEHRRGGPVVAAFSSATTPTVAEAVRQLQTLGYDEVAVSLFFLAPGRLPDIAVRAAAGPVAAPIGATDAVAQLVVLRYREALAGRAVMNCDCCIYRTPWPGREDAVGQPQQVHPHPADR